MTKSNLIRRLAPAVRLSHSTLLNKKVLCSNLKGIMKESVFWGAIVKPGKKSPYVPPPEFATLHLSQV